MNAFKEAVHYTNTHWSNTWSIGTNITWGIFVLIMLLSLYRSLHHKVMSRFKGYDNRIISCYVHMTNKNKNGKTPHFDHTLASDISANFKAIEHISPITAIFDTVAYKNFIGEEICVGVSPYFKEILKLHIPQGRFLNQHDQANREHVCVINKWAKNRMFGLDNPVGQFIMFQQSSLKVVGVVDDGVLSLCEPIVYITDALFKTRYPHITGVKHFLFSIPEKSADKTLQSKLQNYLHRHACNVEDPTKLRISFYDFMDGVREYSALFSVLNAFIWVLGSCFLINSIVNASNMLIVALHKRRQEIVIRKIFGAKTKAIISLIFFHALFVTLIFSVAACILAFVAITLCNKYLMPIYKLPPLIYPSNIVAVSTLLLLIVSCLSSIVPIWKSLKIKPVEGLKQ